MSNTARNIVQLPQLRRPAVAPARPASTAAVPFDEWVAVRDRAAAALLGGTTRVLLTGPAGTGKTVLIDHVARVLRAAGRTVTVQLADTDPAPPEAGSAVFVDEADRLSPAQLKALGSAPGAVLLAGLGTPALRRLPGALSLTLAPLGPEAAQRYIALWLELTGRTTADLDSKAVRRLVELSGGTPRLLATLLSAAAWVAETSGAPKVGADHVDEAAELRSVLAPPLNAIVAAPDEPAPSHRRMAWSAALAGLVVFGATAAVVPRLFPTQTAPLLERGAQIVGKAEDWLRLERPATSATKTKMPPPAAVASAPPPVPVAPATPPSAPQPPAAELAPQPVAVTATPQVETAAPVSEAGTNEQPAPAPEPVASVAAATEAKPEPVPSSTDTAAAPNAEPSRDAKPEPVVTAALPTPAFPAPATAAKAPASKLPAETVEFLLRRGREMLRLDDLSAARLLFRRAAEDGSAEGMFELGRTFDPATLATMGALGFADRDEAGRWYAQAAAAGYRARPN